MVQKGAGRGFCATAAHGRLGELNHSPREPVTQVTPAFHTKEDRSIEASGTVLDNEDGKLHKQHLASPSGNLDRQTATVGSTQTYRGSEIGGGGGELKRGYSEEVFEKEGNI